MSLPPEIKDLQQSLASFSKYPEEFKKGFELGAIEMRKLVELDLINALQHMGLSSKVCQDLCNCVNNYAEGEESPLPPIFQE